MAGIEDQTTFISFVNKLDYSSTFGLRTEHPRNERVTASAEELGTMSKNNLKVITLLTRRSRSVYLCQLVDKM